jgi:predicted neuraminidase
MSAGRINSVAGRFDGIVRESEPGRRDSLMPTLFRMSHASFLHFSQTYAALFCAWFSGAREGADRCSIVVSRLDNTTMRWSVPVVASVEAGRSNQNPVLFETASAPGRLFLLHPSQEAGAAGVSQRSSEVRLLHSDDGAQTWSAPRTVIAQGVGAFIRAPILELTATSELLLPLYFTPAGEFDHALQYAATIRSTDAGQTWSLTNASRIPGTEGAAGVQPAVVGWPGSTPGLLVAFMRNRQGHGARILRSQSLDSGQTWDAALTTALPSNNSSVAAVVAERAGSPVLLLCFNNCGAGRFPLSVAASYDAGVTFVCVRDISGRELVGGGHRFATSQCSCSEQRRGEHSYPSMALDPAAPIVHVSWTHLRKTIAYAQVSLDWLLDPAAGTTGEWQPAALTATTAAPSRTRRPQPKAPVALADKQQFPDLSASTTIKR